MANKTVQQNRYVPRAFTHPGQTLDAKIQEMGMSVREFSLRMLKSENEVSAIIKGEASVTPELAVSLEEATRIPVRFWLTLQRNYDESVRHDCISRQSGYSFRSPLPVAVVMEP